MQTLAEKILHTISIADAGLEKAAAEQDKIAAERQRAAAVVPMTVQALIDNGRIDPTKAEKFAAAFQDHAKTLEVLANVAAHRLPVEAGLGRPEKQAAAQTASPSLPAGEIPASAATRKLFEAFGCPAPATE